MRLRACSTEMGSPFTDVIQSITLEMLSNGDMHLFIGGALDMGYDGGRVLVKMV